jgi:hypothetical protein
VLCLFGRYIEVKVIDEYPVYWTGDFLGIPVRGQGGEGARRGCKAIRFEQNMLVVEAKSEAGNDAWQKLSKKISKTL